MIDKNDPRLTDFVLGELSPAEDSEIQTAIENSPELASVVEEIRQTVELLGAVYSAEAPLRLLDEQKAALAKAGRRDSTTESGAEIISGVAEFNNDHSISIRTGRRWWPIALAATLLGVMIGGAAYLNNAPLSTEVADRIDNAETQINEGFKPPKAGLKESERLKEDAVDLNDSIDVEELNETLGFAMDAQDVSSNSSSSAILNDESKSLDRTSRSKAIRDSQESGFFKAIADDGKSAGEGEGSDDDFSSFKSKMKDGGFRNSLGLSESDLAKNGSVESGESDDSGEAAGSVIGGAKGSKNRDLDSVDVAKAEKSLAAYPANLSLIVENEEDPSQRLLREGQAGGRDGLSRPGGIGLGRDHAVARGGLGGFGGGGGRDTRMDGGGAEFQDPNPSAGSAGIGGLPENAPGESRGESFTFDGSTTTKPSTNQVLDKLLDLVDGPKSERNVGNGQANLGGRSLGDDAQLPSSQFAGREPIAKESEAPLGMDKKSALPNLRANPGTANRPVNRRLASDKPEGAVPGSGSGQPDPAKAPPQLSRFSASSEMSRGRGVAKQDAEPRPSSGKALDAKKLGEEQAWYQYEDLGIKVEDKIVNEVRSRLMPVEGTRTEERVRTIKLDDGSTKEEKYQVQVPFTHQLPQNYTVQVPKRVLTLEADKSQVLVEEMARRIDPNRKREFQLEELFDDNVRAYNREKADNVESGDANGKDLLIVEKLLRELNGELNRDESSEGIIDSTVLLRQLNKSLAIRNAEVRRTRTWKRVKAIPNTTRLMVGDKDELDMTGMQANVQIDGFRARVLIDCFYYNDRGRPLEGNFKLRLPDDASLYFFAFGESAYDFDPKGELAKEEFLGDDTQFVSLGATAIRKARENVWAKVKEAKMVPREKAAHAFRETVRRKVDPALVEWSGAGVFNARVFPLAPHKLHRIVIGYDVNLRKSNGDLTYEFDLPEQVGQCRVELNVLPIDGVEYRIEPDSDPIEQRLDGVTRRRYRFDGPQKNGIRLTATKSPNVLLQTTHDTDGDFWGIQIKPDLPVEQVAGNSRAIFLVDTSLSSNPDKFNVWLKLLESTLENNRDSLKQFGVVFFNVEGHFWKDQYADNTKENVAELMATCETLALEGATDLYGAIEKVTAASWVYGSEKDQDANPSSGPDLLLLSDGAANWGETNLRLISRQLDDHQLGSLFAYQTGLTGTEISGLRFLAGQSGGAVFSVATEDEIKTASTAHRKRPWKLESISIAGATDVMTAGRVQWVYPGQTMTVVGRGKVDDKIELKLIQAGQSKSISISPTRVQSGLASRLYGQVAVGQLESLGAKVFDVAASYARHFRVTGDTCSLLMLESEADYQRFDIKPEEDLFVIKTKAARDLVAETLKKSASELADPKAQLLAWLERLETMPGMDFKMETAFKIAVEEIRIVPISKPLDCSLTRRNDLSKEFLVAIQSDRLDYGLIAAEAKRRGATSVDDAIKVFSSLVERNPGDLVIARDVAFTAMEMGRPAQAYHLLRNVAKARPFEGSIYPALGQCLAQLGQSDMAIVYYEIALGGTFQRQGNDFKQIISAEYMHLLRRIVSGDLDSSVKDFALARLETLSKNLNFESADLLITMMWNTDQTDVDLHVIEPAGEECSYENRTTRSGGHITSDITTGFGPEMYFNPQAPKGKYEIQVKYFGNDQNRTALRNKVHLTIYRGFGTENERVTRKTIQLNTVGEKESVATVGVDQ